MTSPLPDQPSGRRDETSDHKLAWLRAHVGRSVWIGIRHVDPAVHGHRHWEIDSVESGVCSMPYVVLHRPLGSGVVVRRVGIDLIVRAAEEEPEIRDYAGKWDEDLSGPPAPADVIAAAFRAANT